MSIANISRLLARSSGCANGARSIQSKNDEPNSRLLPRYRECFLAKDAGCNLCRLSGVNRHVQTASTRLERIQDSGFRNTDGFLISTVSKAISSRYILASCVVARNFNKRGANTNSNVSILSSNSHLL